MIFIVCTVSFFLFLLIRFSSFSNLEVSLIVIFFILFFIVAFSFQVEDSTCGRMTFAHQDKMLFSTGEDSCSVGMIMEGKMSCHIRSFKDSDKKLPESCSLSKSEAIEAIKKGSIGFNYVHRRGGRGKAESIVEFCCDDNDNILEIESPRIKKPRKTQIKNYDFDIWWGDYSSRYTIDCSELCS